MEVEVYADLLFLINTGMDGLCLLLTGRLLHRKTPLWRVSLAAALGGVYAVFALFPAMGAGVSLLLDVAVCILMCAIAFKRCAGGRTYDLLLSAGVYFLLSMALGGIMTALYHLLNRAGAAKLLSGLTDSGGDGLGSWMFLLLALAGGGLSLRVGRLSRRAGRTAYCAVTVEINGAQAELIGIVDSGNLLRDPMGGRPVICVQRDKLTTILPPPLMAVLDGASTADIPLSPRDSRRVRLIPAGTATGSGLLYGFLPDRILLTRDGGSHVREVDAVVAVSPITTHGVEALVPTELI